MKQMKHWMLAAVVALSGAGMITACSSDDDETTQPKPERSFSEKIVGKWINVTDNENPVPTNEKRVLTILSSTNALFSISLNDPLTAGWYSHQECDLTITGRKVAFSYEENGMNFNCEYVARTVSDNAMDVDYTFSATSGERVIAQTDGTQRLQRISDDHSQAIVGVWEGESTGDEGSAYDDGQRHRWEYKADGTYTYYTLNDGEWEPLQSEYNTYFVDGLLLCTRWKNVGEDEHREWWEIESIQNGVMKWTALRKRADGTTYTATFEMEKVTDQ